MSLSGATPIKYEIWILSGLRRAILVDQTLGDRVLLILSYQGNMWGFLECRLLKVHIQVFSLDNAGIYFERPLWWPI
jgi:hypothetical protein